MLKILLKDSDLFFQNNGEKSRKDIVQALVFSGIFTALTVFTLEAGWTGVELASPPFEAFIGILGVTFGGQLIFSLLLSLLAYRKLDKSSFKKSFFIIAYASTPLLLIAWVPNGFIKLIGIIWTFNFIWVGIQHVAKKRQKEAFYVTLILGAILGILSAVTQIYLISPV
jgi:hypothetical protein